MAARWTVSACAFVFVVGAGWGVDAASPSCFTPAEAGAAYFRALQQTLNVAALNCRVIDPAAESFADHYNDFIEKYAAKMQDNAEVLRGHFSRTAEDIDEWMTRVANDAGQQVSSDALYCQRALDDLDKVLAMAPQAVDGFAAGEEASRMKLSRCDEADGKQTASPP